VQKAAVVVTQVELGLLAVGWTAIGVSDNRAVEAYVLDVLGVL
jgi:hypothetical protein